MTATVHREKTHFLPLDSIRGIAAILVVIHHVILMPTFLSAFPHNAWVDWPFFRSAWLLVDLFFVLSGIVISLSYVKPDFGQFSFREFMVRRLARVYPLHIVMLLAMLVFRLARISLVLAGLVVASPAAFEVNNAYSFFLNVLLLHSLGFIDYLSWNGPSWSISVEFYTYVVFALVLLVAQRIGSIGSLYAIAALLVASCWLAIVLLLDKKDLQLQFDFGFLRCIVGFFIGVLTVKAAPMLPSRISPALQGAFQFAALIACVVLVSMSEAYPAISFFAPLAFAIFLGTLIAYPDAARIPVILAASPLVWLGRRSYSVYMVHALVVLLAEYFVRGIGPRPVAMLDSLCGGLAATLNLGFVLAAVLVLSNFTYRYVEIPGAKLIKHLFLASSEFSSASTAPSARPSN